MTSLRRTACGTLLSLFVIVAAASPALAAAPDALAAGVSSWMQQNGIPSAALAVMRDGQPVQSYGYGGWNPTQPERIASLSKAITGVCIARLAQEGRLRFADTLGTLLAGAFQRDGQPADSRFKTITIEQLLQHRAGLVRDVPPANVIPTETLDARFRRVLQTPLATDPGGQMSYSNIGYLTLGMVVQTITGQPYESVCRHEALDPLGVSGSIDPMLRQRAPNGGWLVSASDYARFVQVFGRDNTVLNAGMHEWLEAQVGGYGMGMFVRRSPSGYDFQHSGEVAGDLGGGAMVLKAANGWTAVVIFGGPTLADASYNALLRLMRSSLGAAVVNPARR
jgi:CubicO group peptidase (beta-lactamase class C family)